MKTYLGVCLLITILLYFWYYKVIDVDSLLEGFSDRYDTFQYNTPYLIIESNKLLCLTLEEDNETISMKPYPTLNNRQLWVPVKDGTTDLRSQPDNRSCNKTTQTKITYNPNEMLLQSKHRPDFFLHIDYNRETRSFDYTLLKKKTKKTQRVVNNLDSPIFTGIVNDRNRCAASNYNCLTCTKCRQWQKECIRYGYNQHINRFHTPYVTFYEHAYNGASWKMGLGNYPVAQWTPVWNDHVSSFYVAHGTRVYVYEHWWYGGASLMYDGPRHVLFQETRRLCYPRWGCITRTDWSWWNDKISSFIIQDAPGNVYYTYSSYCAEERYYCQQCQLFTGQYNPLTCTDETNNLKNIRRFTFKNNELEVTYRISIVGAPSFNQNRQFMSVEDNRNNTMKVTNRRFEFYFVPTANRAQFYQSYLIRNNLLPGNEPLIQSVERDVRRYRRSQRT